MTNESRTTTETAADGGEQYADRCYRSPGAMAGGVALLAVAVLLVTDVLVDGDMRTRLLSVAGLLLTCPVVIAFTLRPAVHAGDERMRVRNPFRTVTVPWGAVESVRSGYSSEVLADGRTFQLWAVPVSLRARNRAARHNERITAGRPPVRGGLFGLGGAPAVGEGDPGPQRARSDRTIDELRELAARHGESAAAQGAVTVRWAHEIFVPALVGALAVAVLSWG